MEAGQQPKKHWRWCPLTPEHEAAILAELATGERVAILAAKHGVSDSTIYKLKIRGRPRTREEYLAKMPEEPTEYEIRMGCREVRIAKGEWWNYHEEALWNYFLSESLY